MSISRLIETLGFEPIFESERRLKRTFMKMWEGEYEELFEKLGIDRLRCFELYKTFIKMEKINQQKLIQKKL